MFNWLSTQYEEHKLFRANACDRDAWPVLKPFGRALARLAGFCPCCAGARVVVATGLAAVCPTGTPTAVGVIYLALLITEVFKAPSGPDLDKEQ